MASATKRFDLVVIGTGAAGSAVAQRCAAAGWKVAVIDDQPYGGTCVLRGCDPKKVLVGVADVVDWHRRMTGAGVAGESRIDWSALMRFKRGFVEHVPAAREASLQQLGIATFHGSARFLSAAHLRINQQVLEGGSFVVASGALPRPLGIAGEEHLITSTQFLELETLPRRIAFVGAGYIGFEFAHLAQRAGAQVTLLGRAQPLRGFDPDHVRMLVEHTRHIGVDVRLDANATGVEQCDSRLRLSFEQAGTTRSIEADLVVHSAGRVPATQELHLDAAGVHVDERGAVRVNEYLQSVSHPRVYAAGDAALPPGSLPLTPVASHEAHIVAANLLKGNIKRPDYRGAASVVFTVPPLARAGLSEQEAREQGLDVIVKAGETHGWYTNRSVRASTGGFKTIAERATGRLLGAHLLGHRADETINLFALAIRTGLKAVDVRHAMLGYPTSTSDAVYMV